MQWNPTHIYVLQFFHIKKKTREKKKKKEIKLVTKVQ